MDFVAGVFLWSLQNFLEESLYGTTVGSCFWELVLKLYIHSKCYKIKIVAIGKSTRKISEICSNLTLEQRGSCGFDVFIMNFPTLLLCFYCCFPANACLFIVNNRNTKKSCEICSKLTVKSLERPQWRCSSVFILNFKDISDLFYYWNWTGTYLLGLKKVFNYFSQERCFYFTFLLSIELKYPSLNYC